MIWRGEAPYKDHLLCRTQEDLDGLLDEHREAAEALVAGSEWPGHDRLLVVCVDQIEERVVGVTSETADSELLFVVAEDRRNEGIGQLMVGALLPELGDVTEDEALSEDWYAPYLAVAGSSEGAGFLHSLTNEFGWKALALIDWSGFDEERDLWRKHRDEEKGRKRVLPPPRICEDLLEVQIYTWPDGSDVLLQIDTRHEHGDAFLVVRWIDLPSTWRDPTTGENDDPVFAIDPEHETGGHQRVTLDGTKRFPAALERKMVGLFLDLGIERPGSFQSSLVSWSSGDPVVVYPRFVPDDRWAARYDEARAWLDSGTKDDLLDEVPFFYLYRGKLAFKTFVNRPMETTKLTDEGWTAVWRANEGSSTWSMTLEGAVDEALFRELVLPESKRAAWEAERVERGTMLVPTAEEEEVFRLLGETLPFWWSSDRLVEWLRGRQ